MIDFYLNKMTKKRGTKNRDPVDDPGKRPVMFTADIGKAAAAAAKKKKNPGK